MHRPSSGSDGFSASAGKRLCGKMGGGAEGYNDDASSQWYEARTSNGTYAYPYGNGYNPVACNGSDAGKGATVEVASMRQCHSTISDYSGAYDLSGNVWEWVDSCIGNTGYSDNCRIRGGGFVQAASDIACAAINNGPRTPLPGEAGHALARLQLRLPSRTRMGQRSHRPAARVSGERPYYHSMVTWVI